VHATRQQLYRIYRSSFTKDDSVIDSSIAGSIYATGALSPLTTGIAFIIETIASF
jgi:hypothetical protein